MSKPYKRREERPKAVKVPVQVYMDRTDRSLLDQVARAEGISRAEVLRRGVRAYARQRIPPGEGPLDRFMREIANSDWPPGPTDIGVRHDDYLAEIYLDNHQDIA